MRSKWFLLTVFTVLAVHPALADENTIFVKVNGPDKATAKTEVAAVQTDSEPAQPRSKKWGERLTALPKATAGIVCGVTVGVPAKIAREVSHESLRMRNQLADDLSGGDKPDLVSLTLGSSLGMPYGLVSGLIKGSIYGVQRGVECGYRKPFSRESMSMTDPH